MNIDQSCTVIRPTSGEKRLGMPSATVFETVSEGVPCRVDTAYRFTSRLEVVPEEYIGRNHGMLFMYPESGIRVRDIIVIENEAYYSDHQYEVLFVDAVRDSGSVHHLECTIARRDENVSYSPLPEDP